MKNFLSKSLVLFCFGLIMAGSANLAALGFECKAYRIKPPSQTMNQLNERIKSNPSDAQAFCDRGQAYLSAGESEEAIKDYDRALALNAKLGDALTGRAYGLAMERRYSDAIADLDRVQALNDHHAMAQALYQKSLIYQDLKQYDKIPELYDRLLTTKDIGVGPVDRENLHENKAKIFLLLKKPDAALRELALLKDCQRRNLEVGLLKGKALGLKADWQGAERALTVAIEQGKADIKRRGEQLDRQTMSELYGARAAVYEKLGQAGKAKADRAEELKFKNRVFKVLYD
ncbi:MAG: tetratricopeptide repeat protein [Candidatus Obscuribacterales bacterium]|nr:tetratricopeptide repeat protein [Candidatus Obscuribacterales bacterium]